MNDCQTVWAKCLQLIQSHINEQSFNTWFKPIKPVKLVNSTLTIQVPSQFFYEWLEEHYIDLLRQAIDNELGKSGKLEYSIVVNEGKHKPNKGRISIPIAPKQNPVRQQRKPEQKAVIKNPFQSLNKEGLDQNSQLNPRYIFENFIEGDSNRLARTAGLAVADKPGVTSFNPLMLYGGVGLGKTHLVQAIGNRVKLQQPDRFVLYVSSEKFANQVIDAFRTNSIQEFGNFYLQVDVLIIDDIQFLAGKEKTQEIFFHIFNHLHQSGKQIIMTSDCPPKELQGLQERLISRFKWGLTADLQQPDYETRKAIILKKLETDNLELDSEVVEYLACNVSTNIRELEGVLISLIAQSSLNQREVDVNLAKGTLNNIVKSVEEAVEIDVDYIQKKVSDFFEVEIDQLKAKTRKRHIVVARQVAMYLTKEYTDMPLKTIGKSFGGRDHSTIIHAIRTVQNMMETDTKFYAKIQELQNSINI